MDRRTLLGAAGTVGIGVLAGCSSNGGSQTETPTQTPTMTDSEFTVTRNESGTETDDATVSFDDTTVTVEGTIWGSNSCQTAELDSADYDDAADELTITVATTEREDAGDVCTQAIVEIDYRATISFERGLPGSVVVTHARDDDSTQVTTASP